jgi:hypothetical protein
LIESNPQDLLTLNVMPNPEQKEEGSMASRAPFVCWLSLKEMTGAIPFIALRSCGCVFSDRAIRSVVPSLARGFGVADKENGISGPAEPVACPNCGKSFDPTSPKSVLPIYPSVAVQTVLLEALLSDRAAARANKKRKADKGDKGGDPVKDKKKKADKGPAAEGKRNSDSPAPRSAPSAKATAVGSSVHTMLAEQEKKRLAAHAGMSDAVRSMFHARKGDKKDDTSDFFGRTFTRVSSCQLYLES